MLCTFGYQVLPCQWINSVSMPPKISKNLPFSHLELNMIHKYYSSMLPWKPVCVFTAHTIQWSTKQPESLTILAILESSSTSHLSSWQEPSMFRTASTTAQTPSIWGFTKPFRGPASQDTVILWTLQTSGTRFLDLNYSQFASVSKTRIKF